MTNEGAAAAAAALHYETRCYRQCRDSLAARITQCCCTYFRVFARVPAARYHCSFYFSRVPARVQICTLCLADEATEFRAENMPRDALGQITRLPRKQRRSGSLTSLRVS